MEGLWTAEFGSSTGMFGGGVAVFRDGRIMGGDGTHYYLGEYRLHENMFVSKLTIFPFIPGAKSVFGTVGQILTLELTGVLSGADEATAQGYPVGMPQARFGVKLKKRL